MHCPSVCPFSAFVQAEHPLQVALQQTPSAITPDVHSKVETAVAPLALVAAHVPLVAPLAMLQ
jgi:hypothetical protein